MKRRKDKAAADPGPSTELRDVCPNCGYGTPVDRKVTVHYQVTLRAWIPEGSVAGPEMPSGDLADVVRCGKCHRLLRVVAWIMEGPDATPEILAALCAGSKGCDFSPQDLARAREKAHPRPTGIEKSAGTEKEV